jgi:hypothetical protein
MTHSKRDLINAGKLLASYIPYPYSDEALDAFRTAHGWRLSHMAAMRAVRSELRTHANRQSPVGVTAGRLKRIASIRKKLRSTPLSLYAIQDIGGCRAIVGSMTAVEHLTEFYLSGGSKFGEARPYDYIAAPKPTGYRSRHFVFSVDPTDGVMRRRIEVQLRTKLQHAWATAVEAVGLVRGEDLKGNSGSPEWLRLFAIMASELAHEEGCSLVPGVSEDAAGRRAELGDLNKKLKAVATLESYNQTISKIADTRTARGSSFLVRLDLERKIVDVQSNYMFGKTAAALLDAETSSSVMTNAVIIEVDRVSDLLAAYPNYYLDVHMFTERLKLVLGGNPKRPQLDQSGVPDAVAQRLRKWGNLGEYLRVYHQRKR